MWRWKLHEINRLETLMVAVTIPMSCKCIYKACSKKERTFAIKTLFYNILSTVPFKVVPSTGDTPFPTFLPLLECFLERLSCSSRFLMRAAAFEMRASNSSGVSTFLLQTSLYIQPHKQKSNGFRSGHSNISFPVSMQN